MLADPRVSHFFNSIDMGKQVARQRQFITLVTGGPSNYEGKDMKAAHAKLQIGKPEFDATWQNLEKSLNFFNVPEGEKNELRDIFYSV
jgi:hemoglobin